MMQALSKSTQTKATNCPCHALRSPTWKEVVMRDFALLQCQIRSNTNEKTDLIHLFLNRVHFFIKYITILLYRTITFPLSNIKSHKAT